MKWETYKLKQLCSEIVDCVNKTAPTSDVPTPYKMLRTSDIREGKINLENLNCVTKEVYEKWTRRGKLQKGDVIFTREAPLGEVGLVREEKNYFLGQRLVLFRANNKMCDGRFLMYSLLWHDNKQAIISKGVGSTVAHLRVPECENIEIKVPDLDVQHRIADILSAYDDLIENNQKQIKLLEEAARRLYKEWFVDLRFPGHENTKIVDGVPEGWKKNCAEKFFEITIGKTPPRTEKRCFTTGKNGIPWVSIADMGNSGMFVLNTAENLTDDAIKQYNVKVIPKNTVLLSFKLTVGRVAIAPNDICTNEAIAHFKGRRECEREYIYFYLKNFHYDELGSTSSISKAVNSKIIKAMPFIMPSEKLLKEYSSKTKDIFDLIICKQKMDNDLKIARDRILHKLMSGEMEV